MSSRTNPQADPRRRTPALPVADEGVYVPPGGVMSDEELQQAIQAAGAGQGGEGGEGVGGPTMGGPMMGPGAATDVLRQRGEMSLGSFAEAALPQVAGAASMFVPGLNTVKGAFAVPALVEALRQYLSGEDTSTSRILGHGTMGVAGRGVGSVVGKIGKFGTQQVRNILDTTPVDDYLPNLAIKIRPTLDRAGISKVLQHSADLENQATTLKRGKLVQNPRLMAEAQRAEELADRIKNTSLRGGGSIPVVGAIFHKGTPTTARASGGGSGMLSPASTFKMGGNLARFGNLRTPIEGIVRSVMAAIAGYTGPGREAGERVGERGPRRVPYQERR